LRIFRVETGKLEVLKKVDFGCWVITGESIEEFEPLITAIMEIKGLVTSVRDL
jgi:hypothetical protein